MKPDITIDHDAIAKPAFREGVYKTLWWVAVVLSFVGVGVLGAML